MADLAVIYNSTLGKYEAGTVEGLPGVLAADQHVIDAEAVAAVEAAGLVLAAAKKIVFANDGLIQLGTLDGSPELFAGVAAYPHMLVVRPKDGDTLGEFSIYPKGNALTAVLELSNSEDLANFGSVLFRITDKLVRIYPHYGGTGTAPTHFRIGFDTAPTEDLGYDLGTVDYRWSGIWAAHRNTQSVLGTDHTFAGDVTTDITAGEALAFGDAVYIKADGKAWKADADGAATMPVFGIALATIAAEATGEILTSGWIRDDSWALTAGGIVYASVTPGAISTTAPVGSGDQVQVIGIAKTTKIIHFNPSYELVEIS